jgi:hypothetical protein
MTVPLRAFFSRFHLSTWLYHWELSFLGSIYLHDCTIERFIPIYLIVGGCFGIIKNISNIVQRIHNKKEDKDDENAKTNPFDGLVSCFLLAWFIAGSYAFCHQRQSPNSVDAEKDKYDYCTVNLWHIYFSKCLFSINLVCFTRYLALPYQHDQGSWESLCTQFMVEVDSAEVMNKP